MARRSETFSTPRAISPASLTAKSEISSKENSSCRETPIRRVAIIGTGVIGASWAALFLAKGLDVVATDVAPNAEAALRRVVEAAWPALKRLGLTPGASQSNLKFTAALVEAVAGVDMVQENGPERIDFKKKLYGQLDDLLPAEVIIASSSSGLTMSEIQSGCPSHPERCVIAHPFNPPHLIPLVEIVGGAETSEETMQRAIEFFTSIGKQTVRLNKEVPGHVANRLQAALGREVYHLVAEGVVSAADVDTALCWGPGLRWGIMGNMLLNHLGGGQGGIEHFFQQFTGPMAAWWKVLGQPVLTPEVQKKLIRQRARRGGVALHRRIGRAARRDSAGPDRTAHQRRDGWRRRQNGSRCLKKSGNRGKLTGTRNDRGCRSRGRAGGRVGRPPSCGSRCKNHAGDEWRLWRHGGQ
jgi:3-hydroxyacyl-CoA dehydrogenase